jgi:hypothetical protein
MVLVPSTRFEISSDVENIHSLLDRSDGNLGPHGVRTNCYCPWPGPIFLLVRPKFLDFVVPLIVCRIVALLLPPSLAGSIFLVAVFTMLLGMLSVISQFHRTLTFTSKVYCWGGHGAMQPWSQPYTVEAMPC